MEHPRLVAVVLEVSDLDRSVRLYRSGFGIPLEADDHGGRDRWTSGRHAAASWTEGAFLHFALYESKDGSTSERSQVAFRVDDLEVARARAVEAGAAVIHDPSPQPWGRSARYADPDGNIVERTQHPSG